MYGQQRMWASIGWGVSAICVGWVVDQASQTSLLYNYTFAFNVMLMLWIGDAIVVGKITVGSNRNKPFHTTRWHGF